MPSAYPDPPPCSIPEISVRARPVRHALSLLRPLPIFFLVVSLTSVALPSQAEASCSGIKSTKKAITCLVGEVDALSADMANAQADIVTLQDDLATTDAWVQTLEDWLIDDIDPRLTLVEDDYLTGANLDGYATEVWVEGLGYLTVADLIYYATSAELAALDLEVDANAAGILTNASGVASNGLAVADIAADYLTSFDLFGYATEGWVRSEINAVDHTAYLTSSDLVPYATETWVDGQGYLVPTDIDGYATEGWVGSQGYLVTTDIDGYATETWVSGQGYLVSTDIDGYATETWVGGQGYLVPTDLGGFATETWVDGLGHATQTWVGSQGYLVGTDIDGFATEAWVGSQGYLVGTDIDGHATEVWVGSQGYATETWVGSQGYLASTDIDGYATEVWVDGQGYATETWVDAQGYLSSVDFSGYAEETWVQAQGYLTGADLSGYATEAYADDAVAANTCPVVAEAGPDQMIDVRSVCSTDSYGNVTCSTCSHDFEMDPGNTLGSDAATFAWSILSGSATISDATAVTPLVSVNITPPEDDVVLTEVIEMQLSAEDCGGVEVSTDTVTLTLECTAPAAP
jgi:hypothetical protein